MLHTVAAVYDRYDEAQHAFDDLVAAGFSRENVHLSQSDTPSTTAQGETITEEGTTGSGIKSFFQRLFGTDDEDSDAELYSEAVRHGNYVLTVDVPDDDLVDRATDVLDRHHPIDIDERASQWKSGAWASQASMQQTPQPQTTRQDTKAIPVVEEELKIGKRQVQRGGVRVYQRVIEEPVEESVRLRDEQVKVERHPVDKPASEADISALQDQSIEVRETAEEPVVEKQARVVEEVVVGKETTERQADIRDTVRRTDVEVEPLSGDTARSDDEIFRTHWNTTYANAGGRYEDYLPAYRYGSTLAGSKRFKGQRWSDMEADVRSDWEQRYPGSAWERFKDAIRHGWERMTS